jgi:hypothetical protein
LRCPSCGEEVPADSRFCPFCGRATAADDAGDATTPVDATERVDPAATQRVDPAATQRVDPAATQRVEVDSGAPGTDAPRIASPARGASRECPNCGATNSARRELCGRCGADLDTGSRAGSARLGAADDVEDGDGAARRRVLIALGAIVLVGAVVGVGLWLGVETDEPVERPTFDEGVYPEDPEPLEIANVSVSSAHEAEDGTVHAGELAADGDADTAWIADSDGVGETLRVRFAGPVWIDRVAVWNGDQSDDGAFRARGRAERVAIHVPDGPTIEVSLGDVPGQQAADIPDPVLVRTITVEVLGTYPGDAGVAISDLSFRGWEARGADRER